jgi:hypothetical protein
MALQTVDEENANVPSQPQLHGNKERKLGYSRRRAEIVPTQQPDLRPRARKSPLFPCQRSGTVASRANSFGKLVEQAPPQSANPILKIKVRLAFELKVPF